MAKIDEVKEILNSLRLGLSLTLGLLILIIGSLINKEKADEIDIYFWVGSIFVVILSFFFILIIKSIVKYTKDIKDL
jgi:hypothetical protein